MRILTWNINGIRSVKKEKSLKSLFDFLNADIICLQETKVTRDMLDEETAIVDGYNSYFSYSKVRSGYSGVATFCRDQYTPIRAENMIDASENEDDLDVDALNAEGRIMLTEHLDTQGEHVVIINLYCPRADLDNKERTDFKLRFYKLIHQKCKRLMTENKHVIVLGDFNVSHKLIDHCDPDDPEIFESNPSRQWANTFIADEQSINGDTTKFVDTFRCFHPEQKSAFTCWSTATGARHTNYGTRIDYIFSSSKFFEESFLDCSIRPDIEGSDHCPVVATLKTEFRNARKPPQLCTKYMPEFLGKQQKLKDFFKKREVVPKSDKESAQTVERLNEKRTAITSLESASKRLKTNSKNSQKSIFKFLSKPNKDSNTLCEVPSIEENKESSPQSSQSSTEDNAIVIAQWKSLLKGPVPPPLCASHKEPCALRTVKNKGPNHGKQFYCCARPQGHSTNKEARCSYFKWIDKK